MSIISTQNQEAFAQALNEVEKEENPSEPVKIETEDIFDAELLNIPELGSLPDDPIHVWREGVKDLRDMMTRAPILAELPPTESKVKIFRMNDRTVLADVEGVIELYLNDGWHNHPPTTCGEFLIMTFSRRKEIEE